MISCPSGRLQSWNFAKILLREVVKSYVVVHLFVTHGAHICSRCWFLRLTSLKHSTSSSTETWKCLQGEDTAHMLYAESLSVTYGSCEADLHNEFSVSQFPSDMVNECWHGDNVASHINMVLILGKTSCMDEQHLLLLAWRRKFTRL